MFQEKLWFVCISEGRREVEEKGQGTRRKGQN